jgi:hypothetical protein
MKKLDKWIKELKKNIKKMKNLKMMENKKKRYGLVRNQKELKNIQKFYE